MRVSVWAAIALCLPGAAMAAPSPDAQALVAQLNADLAANPSATAVLQQWCADRELADPPVIVAERQAGRDKPAAAAVRALLRAAPGEAIRYRRVALACGRRVLSRADNWYRPAQLTAAMNTELDTTDHPFGAVVHPLNFHREALDRKVLARPDAVCVPAEIIRNKALLETPDGIPFSLVVETYSRALLNDGPAAGNGSSGLRKRDCRAAGRGVVAVPRRVRRRSAATLGRRGGR